VTIPAFSIIAFFKYEDFKSALLHSSFILIGICFPLILKMYLNSKDGTYTNFNVSNQKQRQSWYIYATFILLVATIILFVTDQSRTFRFSVLFSLILLVSSQVMNYIIKSSLHVSLNIFLSFLIIPMNLMIGIAFFVFTILIAWARLTLKSHTFKEIIAGSIMGLTIGVLYLYFI